MKKFIKNIICYAGNTRGQGETGKPYLNVPSCQILFRRSRDKEIFIYIFEPQIMLMCSHYHRCGTCFVQKASDALINGVYATHPIFAADLQLRQRKSILTMTCELYGDPLLTQHFLKIWWWIFRWEYRDMRYNFS